MTARNGAETNAPGVPCNDRTLTFEADHVTRQENKKVLEYYRKCKLM